MSPEERSYGTVDVNLHTEDTPRVLSESYQQRRSARYSRVKTICICLVILLPVLAILYYLIIVPFLPYCPLYDFGPRGTTGVSGGQNPDLTNEPYAVGFDLSPGYGKSSSTRPCDEQSIDQNIVSTNPFSIIPAQIRVSMSIKSRW